MVSILTSPENVHKRTEAEGKVKYKWQETRQEKRYWDMKENTLVLEKKMKPDFSSLSEDTDAEI